MVPSIPKLAPMPKARPALGWKQLKKRTRLALIAMLLLFGVVGLELIARSFWSWGHHVPFFGTSQIWKSFFPEWERSGIEAAPTSRDDGYFDVLILGASTVADPNITQFLKEELTKAVGRPVRVWNLAMPGRMSIENVWLYDRVRDRRFDLVLYYQGINDVFMNNTPPGAFSDDYSHSYDVWRYEAFQQQNVATYFALPFTLEYWVRMKMDRWKITDRPQVDHPQYAADLRTPPVFQANLERLVSTAAVRGDRLMIMTFAYYIPENYSEEAFAAKQLDYDGHLIAIRTWGLPHLVRNGTDAHNERIVRVHQQHPELLFVDQRSMIPDGKQFWHDCCHFTEDGCRFWAQNVAKAVGAGY